MPLPEKKLIAQLRRMARQRPHKIKGIVKGIGDDCAVLGVSFGRETLVTTDFSLEGIHFRREWHEPESIGHRCLARGLSDIAAMGGDPVAAFLSLAIPPDLPQSWIDRFTQGLIKLARKHGVELAGGDTAESLAGVMADIIVLGAVPKGKAVLRSGAHPGDRIFVSGELGGSAAAISRMTKTRRKVRPGDYRRHFYPEPRIQLGRILRQKKLASAMIDTSDGLSTDLAHICEASGVGAEIDSLRIPRSRVGKAVQRVGLEAALHGGEDYELIFTARPGRRIPDTIAGVPITQIGQITRGNKILLRSPTGVIQKLQPRGWEHFRR